jgi:HlyD family secretion protein
MNFNVMVETIGSLDAERSTVVSSSIGGEKGTIIWLIDEGARVRAGDSLIRLDPTPFEEALTLATTRLAESEAVAESFTQAMGWETIQSERHIASAEFDLRIAELDLLKFEQGDGPLELSRLEAAVLEADQANKQFSGYLQDLQQLVDEGIITENELKQGQIKMNESLKTLTAAKQQLEIYRDYVFPSTLEKAMGRVSRAKLELEQTRKSNAFQIAKAQATLDQAMQQVKDVRSSKVRAEEALRSTTISAPIPGMVVYREEFRNGERRKPRIGDTVWQNQPLLYLPDISSMVVNTFIREVDVHKVQIGTTTSTQVDAFPDRSLEGRVASIGVLAEKGTSKGYGSKVFQLQIELQGETEHLRPGMTARSTIHAGSLQDVLCVPVSAIFIDNGAAFCYVKKSGGFVRTPVVLGSQNDSVIEIREGVYEGEHVALVAP